MITRYLIQHIEDEDGRPTANDGDCNPYAMGPLGPVLQNDISNMKSMAKNVHNTLSVLREHRD